MKTARKVAALVASAALTFSAAPSLAATETTAAVSTVNGSEPSNTRSFEYTSKPEVVVAEKAANVSPDGVPMNLPVANGNPFNLKPGDTLTISNFRRPDFPICFFGFSCLFKPSIETQITEVKETKNGTMFRLNTFGGYMGHPVYYNGALVGVVKGSNGGMGYGYLFPTAQAAKSATSQYKGPRTGLFSYAKANNTATGVGKSAPARTGSSLASSSSKSTPNYVGGVDSRETSYKSKNPKAWTKTGTKYIESVKWNPGTGTFHVNPKPGNTASFLTGMSSLMGSSGETAGTLNVDAMWRETVALGVPDTKSLKQQFVCHAQGSAIRKSDWKLETGRPALASQSEQARFSCNPPRPTK